MSSNPVIDSVIHAFLSGPTGEAPPQGTGPGAFAPPPVALTTAERQDAISRYKDDLVLPQSSVDVLGDLAHYRPNRRIPVAASWGDTRVGLVAPGPLFDVPFDPLFAMTMDDAIFEYLTASATESGGTMAPSIAPTAGHTYKARAVLIEFNPDPDQAGVKNGLITFTFNPTHRNSEMVSSTEAAGVLTGGDVTDVTNTARFNHPPNDAVGGFYYHFGQRLSALPVLQPARAMLNTAVSGAVTGAMTLLGSFSNLGSGSAVSANMTVMHPGAPEFAAYCVRMMRAFYTRR